MTAIPDDLGTTDRVRARVGGREFSGRIVESGYDGEPVVYLRDRRGRERAVRPRRDRHHIERGTGQ